MRLLGIAFVGLMGVLALSVLALSGCSGQAPVERAKPDADKKEGRQNGERADAPTAKEVQKELSEAGKAAGEYSAEVAGQFRQQAQERLDRLAQDFERLQEQSGGMQEAAQDQVRDVLADLDNQVQAATRKMDDLNEAGQDAWTAARDDVQQALDDIKNAYQDARRAVEEAAADENGGADEPTS